MSLVTNPINQISAIKLEEYSLIAIAALYFGRHIIDVTYSGLLASASITHISLVAFSCIACFAFAICCIKAHQI
jgi:hypothetical protein